MNSRRGKKIASEAVGHTDSPSRADFLFSSPNDASVRARFWNWLDDKFTKQTNLIKDMIMEVKNSLMSEIDLKFSSLKSEIIKQAKQEIKNEFTKDINDLRDRISVLEATRVDVVGIKNEMKTIKLESLKQANSSVASEIRISGLPFTKNENLHEIFGQICNTLNIPKPSCKNVYRVRKQKNHNFEDQPIIIKLDSPYCKNHILKSAADFRRKNNSPLRLLNAGFDSNTVFYMNENLTPHYHGIFKKAIALKKNGRLKSVYTRRGIVYVRTCEGDDPIQLNFPEQLDQLFR